MSNEDIKHFDFYDMILKVAFIVLFIMMAVLFLYVFIGLIDSLTIKEIGEKSVPCLDELNRPFEDELCTKILHCSWLGLTVKDRCVNVGVSE